MALSTEKTRCNKCLPNGRLERAAAAISPRDAHTTDFNVDQCLLPSAQSLALAKHSRWCFFNNTSIITAWQRWRPSPSHIPLWDWEGGLWQCRTRSVSRAGSTIEGLFVQWLQLNITVTDRNLVWERRQLLSDDYAIWSPICHLPSVQSKWSLQHQEGEIFSYFAMQTTMMRDALNHYLPRPTMSVIN